MSNINTVAVEGNLTRDVELRHTPSGMAVANLGLAVNRSKKNAQTDEWEDETSFFDITVWGARGETCAKKLTKGSQVFISGRLEQQRWTNDANEPRSKVVIVAERINGPDFFSKTSNPIASDETGAPSQPAESGAPAAPADDDIPF